jgi:hypothetical protein
VKIIIWLDTPLRSGDSAGSRDREGSVNEIL